MSDLISRQAAIAALGERPMVWTWSDYELGARNQYDADVLAIETVPAAQSFSCDHENDTISRQATIELIERMKPYHQDADDIAEMIANMPSAQPKSYREGYQAGYKDAQPERKRGRWITLWRLDVLDGYQCSACKAWSRFKFNFCRNCGADMRGEQE